MSQAVEEPSKAVSFLETMGPRPAVSPPPLLLEQREEREPREERRESFAAPSDREVLRVEREAQRAPRRTRPRKAAAAGPLDAGLVPAAQQSQLLRKSAAEKIQSFFREYRRHHVEHLEHLEEQNRKATRIQATWRAFAVRRSRRTKAPYKALKRSLKRYKKIIKKIKRKAL